MYSLPSAPSPSASFRFRFRPPHVPQNPKEFSPARAPARSAALGEAAEVLSAIIDVASEKLLALAERPTFEVQQAAARKHVSQHVLIDRFV